MTLLGPDVIVVAGNRNFRADSRRLVSVIPQRPGALEYGCASESNSARRGAAHSSEHCLPRGDRVARMRATAGPLDRPKTES